MIALFRSARGTLSIYDTRRIHGFSLAGVRSRGSTARARVARARRSRHRAAVFLFDETAHVIVMEDTGAASTDLKTLLKSGTVSPTTAAQIGAAAGTFLAALHAWGKGNVELCATVAGNEQAKRVTAWAFYGRLESTLVGPNAPPKLCDPPLDVAEEDLVAIRRIAEETTRACLEVDDTVSHPLESTPLYLTHRCSL